MDTPALLLFHGNDCAGNEWAGNDCAGDALPVRGVGWVLRWAAVAVVLAVSAMVLTGFAYQLAAEQALARAAQAGLREAALPRATNASVEAAVRRRLADGFGLERATQVTLARAGERLAIRLSVPTVAALPRWLPAGFWSDGAQIEVRKEQPVAKLLGAR